MTGPNSGKSQRQRQDTVLSILEWRPGSAEFTYFGSGLWFAVALVD